MKKRLLFSVLTVLVMAQPAIAGMVVTDPSSYTYYVEQLAKAEQQIDTMVKQLESAEITADKLTKMKQQLEGTYNRIAGLQERMTKRVERLGGVPANLERQSTDLYGGLTSNTGYLPDTHNMSEWEKLEVQLDSNFCDPRDPNCDEWAAANGRHSVRQRVLKTTLARSTITLSGLQDRMKDLSALFMEIGKGTQRDEMNLTNRLLAELIIGQQELIAVMAQFTQAETIMKYQGVTDQGDAAGSPSKERVRTEAAQWQPDYSTTPGTFDSTQKSTGL